MLIEHSQIINLPVSTSAGEELGKIDQAVFNGRQGTVFGWQLRRGALVKQFGGLEFKDVTALSRQAVEVASREAIQKNLSAFDQLGRDSGRIVGVKARTESGVSLGHVSDLLIDAETGGLVRFYLKNFLTERIIPLKFLVTITPKEIVFKDIVNQPIFDQAAVAEIAA